MRWVFFPKFGVEASQNSSAYSTPVLKSSAFISFFHVTFMMLKEDERILTSSKHCFKMHELFAGKEIQISFRLKKK